MDNKSNFDNLIDVLYGDKVAKELSKERKCPFRKIYTVAEEPTWNTKTITEEFQDCIGKECAKWSPVGCSA